MSRTIGVAHWHGALMSGIDAVMLFSIMVVLAAVPSASVALVVARAATGGFSSGASVAAGIVLADLLFVVLAVQGMTMLAEVLGSLFVVLRYMGGLYLLWLGFGLLRPGPRKPLCAGKDQRQTGLITSFVGGFLLTLGDVKAILFYASLFPAFLDPASLSAGGLSFILMVTVVTVGGVKLLYAAAASRIAASLPCGGGAVMALRPVAGGVVMVAGATVIAKA